MYVQKDQLLEAPPVMAKLFVLIVVPVVVEFTQAPRIQVVFHALTASIVFAETVSTAVVPVFSLNDQ